jgi:cytochrome oxidase Cu insertion factor (SCO1/SenC/PrrC family)
MSAGAKIGSAGAERRRPSTAMMAGVLVCAAGFGVGAGVVVHLASTHATSPHASTPALNGLHGEATWGAGARPAPAITTLVDQTGRRFSLASLRGRTVAITFFDSYCNQACPLEGRALAAAESALPAAERPTLVVVSVNPRDTIASTRAAVRTWGLTKLAPWHWLRGTHRLLARVWAAYRIFVAPPAHGDITHTEALYLLDRRGDERSAYLYPFLPTPVSADLRVLAGPRRGPRG